MVGQTEACRKEQDKRGEAPYWWYAAYPGSTCSPSSTARECGVEHPSRLCDAQEQAEDAARGLDPKACRRADSLAGADVVGLHGGDSGVAMFCVAPREHRRNEAYCLSFYRDTHGARLVSGVVLPSPTPPPPAANDVCLAQPHVPIKPVSEAQCKDLPGPWVNVTGSNGERLCLAASTCKPGDPRRENGECPIDPSLMDGKTECGSFPERMRDGIARGHQTVTPEGWIRDEGRGLFDACGYRYPENREPHTGGHLYDWRWMAWCPPLPRGTVPSPTPPPVGPKVGFVPCPAHPDLLCPIEGTCPSDEVARAAGMPEKWLHRPTRVGLGEKPMNSPGYAAPARINLNSTPRDDPPHVPQRGNKGESEQWADCANAYAALHGPPPMWCEGPAGNRLEVNQGGGPYNRWFYAETPGRYRCCVRPHNTAEGVNETCRDYQIP